MNDPRAGGSLTGPRAGGSLTGLVRRVLLVTLLGVVLYGLFVVYTGLQEMGSTLARFHVSALFAALGLACFNYGLRFAKWQYYLKRLGIAGIPLWDSLLVFLTGFVLTITPGKVGEVFKSAVLFKTHGVPVARTAPIVIADRLTDVIGIVTLIVIGGATFPGGLPWALAGAVAVAAGLVLISWQAPALWLCAHLEQRRGKLGAIVPKLREALISLRIVASPGALLVPSLLSVVGWGAEGLALYTLLCGFEQHVPLLLAVLFYATATLAGALVPIPGGLGLVEGMLRQALLHLGGVEQGAATASMILVRLATLWWAVLVGFIALFLLRLRFPAALSGDVAANAQGARIG
ncbi:MAG TPA: lysylphosphatidylglycerol synthase transmembrane domain-containing protein [Polyangiaceae bacterium]